MSTTTNLIRQVLGDGARNTKFDIIFQFSNPATYNKVRDAAVLVKTASFPGVQHTPVNLMYKGRPIPVRGQVKYTNTWECTFYMPENHDLKVAFETWIQALDETVYFSENPTSGESSTRRRHNSSGYTVDITLYQLNIDENKQRARYVLHNAFPIEVQSVSIQAEQPAGIEELSVTFSYAYFTEKSATDYQNIITDGLDELASQITTGLGANSEFVSSVSDAVLDLSKNNNLDEKLQKMVLGYNPDYSISNFISSGVQDVVNAAKDLLGNAVNSIR